MPVNKIVWNLTFQHLQLLYQHPCCVLSQFCVVLYICNFARSRWTFIMISFPSSIENFPVIFVFNQRPLCLKTQIWNQSCIGFCKLVSFLYKLCVHRLCNCIVCLCCCTVNTFYQLCILQNAKYTSCLILWVCSHASLPYKEALRLNLYLMKESSC